MPRKNPLPPEELEIGARVRIVRERRGLSRAACARELATDSSTLTSIEHGRAPLRYGLAERICARFGINQRWLATGQLPTHYKVTFYGYDSRIPPRTAFSKAYSEHYAQPMEKTLREAAKKSRCPIEELDGISTIVGAMTGAEIADESALVKERLRLRVERFLHSLPPEFLQKYSERVTSASEDFWRENARAIRKKRLPPQADKQKARGRFKQ